MHNPTTVLIYALFIFQISSSTSFPSNMWSFLGFIPPRGVSTYSWLSDGSIDSRNDARILPILPRNINYHVREEINHKNCLRAWINNSTTSTEEQFQAHEKVENNYLVSSSSAYHVRLPKNMHWSILSHLRKGLQELEFFMETGEEQTFRASPSKSQFLLWYIWI